jgi:DUF1365 family protein
MVEHIPARTFHGRKGRVANSFRYSVDYLLLDPEAGGGPRLFARNRAGLMAVNDRDHGGAPGAGTGAAWVRQVLAEQRLDGLGARILLLAQPRVLGHVFNPVSFWLCHDAAGALRLVIAEVTNTYGDRHSYLCHRDDFGPIGAGDEVFARKMFHVSPFQEASGLYGFRFDIRSDRIAIRIEHFGEPGLVATLEGPRRRLTSAGIIAACLRRPLGSRRVLALIHWQAARLWAKGAGWHDRPAPPADEVSR